MSDRKKRVLCATESSFLSTGYATLSKHILGHLHNTGKYEIAEHSSYGSPRDPRQSELPWKYYGNLPDEHNQDEVNQYNSNPSNQFGEWRWEQVCLDFQPDIVIASRDPWMDAHILNSPFRRMYKFLWQPTVDSVSQNEDWLYDYSRADAILTYTDWSTKVLEEEGRGNIKVVESAPPGIDLDLFKPALDKKANRRIFGLLEDSHIIGTVMRNQKRKLYPDLFEVFAEFIKKISPDTARKTFLYVHARYPDLGWDFPRLLNKLGLSNKVLFTYACFGCGLVFPQFYSDTRVICPRCNQAKATFPDTQHGVDRKILPMIINNFDVYVQYSISEGFGIPMVEAAACGVPVMAVDYSGMADVVRKTKGYPIKVQRMCWESESGMSRAWPDNTDLIDKLIKFFQLPEGLRRKKGFEARQGVEKNFNWTDTGRKWEQCIDKFSLPSQEQTWQSPPQLHSPVQNVPSPEEMNDENFVNWALINTMGRQDLVGSYFALKIQRDLMWGVQADNMGGVVFNDMSTLGIQPRWKPYNREIIRDQFLQVVNKKNQWEQQRIQHFSRRS